MAKPKTSEAEHIEKAKAALLAAALPHVVFDGWSRETLRLAMGDCAVDAGLAQQAYPRGAIDMALAFHRRGDDLMVQRMLAQNQSGVRYRDRIMAAVRTRLMVVSGEKDIVRRGITLLSMPAHIGEGTAAVWQTCDAIWTALGDTSDDINWYTKRATLSAVYSSTVLFWLGDTSVDDTDTWAFLDRRIENVMQFEKLKAGARKNPLIRGFMNGPGRLLDRLRAPSKSPRRDLPGYVENQFER